jgi:uncharacterized membrane protein
MNPNRIQRIARISIAISFAAFGLHQIIYGSFVTRVIGALPKWVPIQTLLADLTGLALIAAAIAMYFEKRNAAVALGTFCLVSTFLTHFPAALGNPANPGRWVFFGKGLTIAGCAFTVAGSLGDRFRYISPRILILYGKCALGAFMILSGVLHFLLRDYVATLFPPWIPLHMFFTLFAGVLLICGGLGMMIPVASRSASLLSGIMILAWVPLIHIPLALKDLKNPSESVPVFEALAFGSLAVLAFASQPDRETALNNHRFNQPPEYMEN